MNKATKRVVAFAMAVMLVISSISFGNMKAEAAEAYIWGPIDFSTAVLKDNGVYVGASNGNDYGIQIADKSNSVMTIGIDGLHITAINGGWKAINIQTGVGVGGTEWYAGGGFKPTAGKEYKVTFDATVEDGSGQVRVRGNNTGDWQTTSLSSGTIKEIEYTYTQAENGGNLQIDTGSTLTNVGLIINNLIIKEIVSIIPTQDTEIYNMQNDLASKVIGSTISGTVILAQSGNPTITVEDSADGKKLVITNRTDAYFTVDIKLTELNLNPGCEYKFAIRGKTIEANATVVLAQSNDPWAWKQNVTSDASGNFTLTKIFAYDELQTEITAGQNLRIQANNTSDFEIDSIVITEIGNAEEPSVVNNCLKIVTGTSQWEGAKITAEDLKLQLGRNYKFSMTVYAPDIPVGIVAQTTTYSWIANAGAGDFDQNNKQWITISGNINVPIDGTLSNYDISIVKMGDGGNYDSQVATFYIDNIIVTDITDSLNDIVFNEDFESTSHKFTANPAIISVVADPESSVLPSEPSGENHCLRIVTGTNQWEGANIKPSVLGLQFGKKYTFSLDVYTPNKAVGIKVQHSGNWIQIIEEQFVTPETKNWSTISGTFDLTGDPFTFNDIQIVKAPGLNDDVKVTFYIDNFIVTDADTGIEVYSEEFEKGSHKFTGGGANLSIIKESDISLDEIEEPVTGKYALDVTPLKDIYKDYFLIGNIVNPSDFNNSTVAKERYDIFKHHYNVLTFENSMKPDAMWNSNNYNVPTSPPSFSVDQNIKTMLKDGFVLHGHALAWHGQSPNWIHLSSGKREATTGADVPVYKPYAEVKANLDLFVSTIAGHYYNNQDGLEVYSWDVLNEAIRKNPSYAISEETWGYHTIGHIFATPQWNSPWYLCYQKNAPAGVNPWDYVYDLFYAARKADSNAILYYNDYGMEDPNQVKMVVNMVNAVNKRYASEHPEAGGRLLIEGIGMQEHDTINTNLDNVDKAIKAYIDTGCVVSISELDVGVPGYKTGDKLTLEDEIKQALYYAKLFNIFKKYSEGIERVTFWGLDDEHSWRSSEICLIFDGNLRTKLAYDAIADPDEFIEKYDTTPVIPTDSLESTAEYGTPVIGSFNDELWNATKELPIVRHLMINYGATGTAKVLWDEENLYLQVKVNDSLLNKSNANVWEQDSVEVFFDETNCKSATYTDGMAQYRINYDNLLSTNLGGTTSANGFESYTKIISGGYMVEMKIPYQFHNPAVGDYIGFDAQINDANDKGVRNDVIMWSDTSGESYANGSKWGTLKLEKIATPTPEVTPEPTPEITPKPTPAPTPGPTNPTPTDVNNSDKQTDINITVNGSEGYTAQVKDNTVIVTAPEKYINDSINKLTEDLIADPNKEQVIELKLSGIPDTVNKASFNLPKQIVTDIVEKTDASLKIDIDSFGTLIITNEALSTIMGTDNNDIKFIVESVTETKKSKLNEAQIETVGNNPVYDFSVYSGDRRVSDFGTGSITVILPYTPSDDMNVNAIIVYYVDSIGNIHQVNNSFYDEKSGTVSFTVSHFSVYMISYNYKTFMDIDNSLAKVQIEYLAARNLFKGVAEGDMYLPNQKVTRGEFVQMLQNILNVTRAKASLYKDVGMKSKYYSAIMCFKGAGLLDGISVINNQFKPDAAITREEMAVILANISRYKGIVPESYVDMNTKYGDLNKISDEYISDVRLAVSLDLMNYSSKMSDGMLKFNGKSAGTRQQAARIQVNLLELLKKNNIFK